MITAMKMMKEACRSNDSWNGCEKCPFDSFCTMLQRSAIELYDSETNDSCEYWCGADEPQDNPEEWEDDFWIRSTEKVKDLSADEESEV